MRARFFAAMGLACATTAIVMPACKKEKPPPDPYPHFPSCPSGDFCASVADIERDARAAAADASTKRAADAAIGPPAPPPAPEMAGAPYGDCPMTVPATRPQHMTTFSIDLTRNKRATSADQCCYIWSQPCGGGRPIASGDRFVVADVVPSSAWCARETSSAIDSTKASRWAREASFEHASIAAFARASLALLALGAPPDLIAGAHRAALDEIEHAKDAFAIASRHAGRALGPGALPFAPIDASPIAVALETLHGGCVNETVAALAAMDAEDEPQAHARIAKDESMHAELAFRTIAWLVRAFGEPVKRAIARELDALEAAISDDPIRRRALHEIVLPCLRTLIR
jgi:hypothetical protein